MNSEITSIIARIDSVLADIAGTTITSSSVIADHLLDLRLDVAALDKFFSVNTESVTVSLS